jgi:hypothetical protein
MEAENFEKVLLKESLHRSSQNNMNQAEAGYNAKWFRRGGLFALKWLQERSYSEEEVYDLIHKRDVFWTRYKNTYSQDYISTKDWFEQFKKK